MPRDLPVGNGTLLLNFDRSYNPRDICWPHVGQELHTREDVSHTGVRLDAVPVIDRVHQGLGRATLYVPPATQAHR